MRKRTGPRPTATLLSPVVIGHASLPIATLWLPVVITHEALPIAVLCVPVVIALSKRILVGHRIIEIIGGSKKYREALKKKIAEEIDPKGILAKPKKKK